MKTKMMFTVLFAMTLGCRNEFIDLCPNDYTVAVAVAIVSDCAPPEDGISPVPTGDTTNADAYKLHAYVYNSEGIMVKDVEWQVSDSELLVLAPIEASAETRREAMTLVQTTADILDRGGDVEPWATVTACVTNDCEAIDASCVECLPEVCSEPHVVRSVINAEGDWELSGATFPFPVPIRVRQTGRKLEAAFYEPEINGRQINFSSGSTSYVGLFDNETHVTGEAIVSPSGDNLGTWTAVKCPDTGCD